MEKLEERLRDLSRDASVRMVVLFGSFARDYARKESDVDVGILTDRPINILDWTCKVMDTARVNNVDVVDLRRVNPLLAAHIARYGKLIYEREPSLFNEFRCLAFRKFMDMKKFWRAQEAVTEKFLEGLS